MSTITAEHHNQTTADEKENMKPLQNLEKPGNLTEPEFKTLMKPSIT